jgi:hypothetical protein
MHTHTYTYSAQGRTHLRVFSAGASLPHTHTHAYTPAHIHTYTHLCVLSAGAPLLCTHMHTHILTHIHTYTHLCVLSAGAPLPFPDEVDLRPGHVVGHKMAAIGTKVYVCMYAHTYCMFRVTCIRSIIYNYIYIVRIYICTKSWYTYKYKYTHLFQASKWRQSGEMLLPMCVCMYIYVRLYVCV